MHPFRVGMVIRIGATQDYLCPVACMHTYISSHLAPYGPLFVLTPHRFLTFCLADVPNINMHSFRIGGASDAASAGVPNSTIQILGKWTSEALSVP